MKSINIQTKRIIASLMIAIILLQINLVSVAGFKVDEEVNLKSEGRLDCLLQFYKESISGWSYKVAYYICGTDNNGNKVPAFCIERAKQGAGELGSYDSILEECNDDGIYTILTIYNNKKYRDWGIENEEDYYLAVQTAMHCYSDRINPKDEYRVGEDVLEGYTPESIDEIQERGTAVLDTAESLYNSAMNKQYKQQKPTIGIQEIGEWEEESINGVEVYSKKYEINSNYKIKEYSVDVSKIGNEAKVLNNNNIEQENILSENSFKLVIPKSKITKNNSIDCNIKINAKIENIPTVLYARSGASDKQDYAVFTYKNERAIAETKVELEYKIIPELDLNIEKRGIKEAESGSTIEYEFDNLENRSNVPVENFIWRDVLPTDSIRLTKINTGTWNMEQEYSIWYKTNLKNEYQIYKDGFSTKVNNCIDIKDFKLEDDEFITEYELRFGTVEEGFKEEINPKIECLVLEDLNNGHVFVNNTFLSAIYDGEKIEKSDEWKTVIYNKETPKQPELPKTGF